MTEAMNYTGLKKGFILTLENNEVKKVDDKQITILPVWKWIFEELN
jgi:hypothetical protein